MHLAAEQVVDRLIEGLAHDVPASHFNAAQHPHEAQVGMLRIAAGINDTPELFSLERIGADDVSFDHVLYQPRHHLRVKRHAVSLAEALNPVVRRELQKYPVPAPVVRRRVANHVCLDVLDLHEFLLSLLRPAMSIAGREYDRTRF